MKRFFAGILMMVMLSVMIPAFVSSANAQTYSKPGVYKRHRNIINIGIGTGAGALLGGLIGGKKGALIGAAAGAGGSALYSYKIRPKKRVYYNR